MIVGAHAIIYSTNPAADRAFFLMCDDVVAFVTQMRTHGIACRAVEDRGWGVLTQLSLPGGGTLGVCQPRHARPEAMR